jgi:hypothetical protein
MLDPFSLMRVTDALFRSVLVLFSWGFVLRLVAQGRLLFGL